MVSLPYQELFLGLLAVSVAYSLWSRWNPRWPVYGALLALAGAVVAQGLGASGAANQLALDVVFLLMAGVGLIAADRWRAPARSPVGTAAPDPPGADPAEQDHPAAEHPLDDLERQGVAVVDAPGQQHDRDERPGDREPDQRQ